DPVNTAPHSWTVKPGAIMVDGKVKAIQVANFFGDVDAFDPSKRGFSDSVDKLYSENAEQGNRFPARAKFRDIPLEGQLAFDVDPETLPPGLTFDGQKISGRPQVGGEFPIRMIATDGRGETAEAIYTLFVGMPVTEPVIETPTTEPKPREEIKPEEKTPDLADHDLPKVLKVNPKRDATIPLREQIRPEPVIDESAGADVGNAAGLADDNWMNTTVSSEQDVSGNIRVIDLKVEGKDIAVQITDQAVDQAETFKGEMADGSKLPDWVKVDPSTGLTTAEPPQGAASIEMRVIAEDSSGNERAIDLVLNPEALREQTQESEKTPREERREARQERREARIEAREERRAERAENRAIREITRATSEVSVLSDGRVQFAEGLTAAGEGAMQLMRMVAAPEAVTIEITDEARVETTRYEIRQQDGTAAPDWVQVNAATGELIIEAEQNTGTLQLTLVAVDGSEQRSIDLEVNLDQMREDEDEQIEEVLEGAEEIEDEEATSPDEQELGQFLPLDVQIDAALAENNYGQVLQTAMQSRV
ncbi:MAG: Ig domain-containing protein, partial [Alphaproteobacteria bacterium]|nr:Ig domain-containing protein [Alphaproteobacteria bacterium]